MITKEKMISTLKMGLKGVHIWNRWKRMTGNPKGDFRWAYLTEADLRGADLGGADLRWAYLRGAILAGADLTGAILRGADLIGADLIGADLRGADLIGADLIGADLRGAILRGAELIGADLTGADFTGADFRWADLTGADLTGADLRGADLRGADLGGADLTDIIVNWQSHQILSEILIRAAKDNIQRKLLASYVRTYTDECWDELLWIDHPEKDWALNELARWHKEGDEAPAIIKRLAKRLK